uniref:Tachykinin 4 n=1 Tax=Propithecus coquereli TaxID=379532 RepID=A0A2K6EHJ2_PROCO
MLPCLTLLLLSGLSLCAAAGDSGEEPALSTEAEPWEGAAPITQRQLQQVKRGKASQFFGLMGKQMGGTPRSQPGRRAGREDEDQGSE